MGVETLTDFVFSGAGGTTLSAILLDGSGGEGPDDPDISINSPADGSEIEGNDVEVSVSCTDCDDYHYHAYIDGSPATPYMHFSDSFTLTDVSFGSHTLDVVLADAGHQDSDIAASISFSN